MSTFREPYSSLHQDEVSGCSSSW